MKINEPKPYLKGFSGSSVVKNPPAKQETGLTPGGQKDPLEKEMQPTPVFLLGKFHGQRSLAAYRSWNRKESDMTAQLCRSSSKSYMKLIL